MKKIAILSSSRVSAGMNTIIYHLLKSCYNNHIESYGILDGFNGLMTNQIMKLEYQNYLSIINQGGTILHTGDPRDFINQEYLEQVINHYYQNQFDCLFVIGGHGSYNIARKLINKGIHCIVIPCTLDNDYSVGYSSALDTLVNMLDKLYDTSSSHQKCTIIKIEGCSNNKLIKDVCSSMDALYVDNHSLSHPQKLLNKLQVCYDTSNNAMILLSSNFNQGEQLKNFIESKTQFEVRYNDITFLYRGGMPNAYDRILARNYAYKAIELYNHQQTNQYLKLKNNKVIAVNII